MPSHSTDTLPLTSLNSITFDSDDEPTVSASHPALSFDTPTIFSTAQQLFARFSRLWRRIPPSWSIEHDPRKAITHILTLVLFLFLCIFLFSIPSLLYLISPSAPTPPGTSPNLDEAASTISGKTAAVAADNAICSELGLSVMKSMSGNAADAAVTTVLCQGVLSPFASGIGGGAFILLHHQRSGVSTFYDARETAPQRANMKLYSDATSAKFGGRAIAVPGELKGLWLMHKRWGRLNWSQVVQPAIKVGEKAKVGKVLSIKLRQMNKTVFSSPSLLKVFTKRVPTKKAESENAAQAGAELPGVRRGVVDSLEGSDVVTDANDRDKHGINPKKAGTVGVERNESYTLELLEEGDKLVNEPLMRLLLAVAEKGPDAFYKDASEQMAREIQSEGGVITADDFKNYKVITRKPVVSTYQGFVVVGAPLPAAGGVSIAMALNMITELEFRKVGRNSYSYQLLVETLKWVFGAGMGLGDPNFVAHAGWQAHNMLSRREALRRAYRINRDRTFKPRYYTKKISSSRLEWGTSHISVVDENRTAISITSTVNLPFGSGVMSNSTGVIFNDQMDSFTTSLTRANAYGVYPSFENRVEAGKRPVSSMCPTIILRNGKVYLVLGGSGGPKAISGVLQTIVNVLDFGDSLSDAISAPRVHHQLVPNKISMEGSNSSNCEAAHSLLRPSESGSGSGSEAGWVYWKSVCEGLKTVGHRLEGPALHGAVQAVLVADALGKGSDDEANVFAASDPRRIGKAAAY